ncbi:hypothetical protein WR25_26188 [Diploscapter pachys]|uniref:Major facilitator superfamily (MFS) profile domain-containing protein n=1 Tax=Diploscapter pachys TaxID=2018661 RepID=A0A2A2KW28_9BILA|nr:hypothetical protein WR25_26188 [Diploscapter pachys]
MIASGFIVANAVAAGFAHIDPYNIGWRFMFAAAGIPAAIQFIGFLFLPDTPRFYMAKGREEEAERVLEKVYAGHQDWVDFEMNEIRLFLNEEEKNKAENGSRSVLLRIFQTPHVRKALLLGCAMQMFQQFVGINTILYYTGTIIQSAGVRDKITTIWISCAISAVQSVGTLAPMKLIEKLGRRPILLLSLIGTILSLCLMGGAFVAINMDSASLDPQHKYDGIDFGPNIDNSTIFKCASFSNCDYCTTSQDCGFCHPSSDSHSGQCLPIMNGGDKSNSSVGFCSGANANYTFDSDFCVTKWTAAPIVVMVIYLLCFAFGMGPMPWVFNSEVYPLWARSTCVSLSTFTNWTFNLLVSLTFLSLGEAIHKYGAFFLYAGISTIGLVLFYFFIPETKGLPIEEVEELFKSKKNRRQTIQPMTEEDKSSDKDNDESEKSTKL